jgi:hypothetical protein
VVCFGTVPTLWYVLELFRQCGMFWNCSDNVVCFGTVPTVWYVLELFQQCGMLWYVFVLHSISMVQVSINHTVGRVPKHTTLSKQFQNIPHCRNSSKTYQTVGTVSKHTTLSEQFQNIPHCGNSSKLYHIVGTVPKYTTPSEQFQSIPHCRNSSKAYHTVGTVPKHTTLSEHGTVPTVWYVLELFRQCGMFWNCSDNVVCFGTVPTVWYVLELFRQCGMLWYVFVLHSISMVQVSISVRRE